MNNVIKILFIAVNPKDTNNLRIDEEVREIQQALRQAEYRDTFELHQIWAVRPADLQRSMLQYKPHIIHFSGHGNPSNEIMLEGEEGKSHPVSTKTLDQLFAVLKDNVRCVVLNACFSKQQARVVSRSVDCVIGMSGAITDRAAIKFSTAFYQALAYGEDVKTAFELGCLQIDMAELDQKDVPKLYAHQVNAEAIKFVDKQSAATGKKNPPTA